MDQDWRPVTWSRPPTQPPARPPPPRNDRSSQLDRTTEALPPAHVPRTLAVAIREARAARGLTQAQLAARICVPAKVIQDHEGGRGTVNPVVVQKLRRALGVKLS